MKPCYFGMRPEKCMWCGSSQEFLKYVSTGINLSGEIKDYYRCSKCFRITPIP